ncbi:hypothetical protein FRC02_000495 [Tulasnella sp. 418]|nr:hypothetical protein FRC02_000495 [Tulasnella sp. 418]
MSSHLFSVDRDDSGMMYQAGIPSARYAIWQLYSPCAMTVSLLQSSPQQARYVPYPSDNHTVTRGRYITSNDPRGYVPVYEYLVNNQWIMMDMDDGYILWTSICKALGKTKAELVKMFEHQQDLIPQLRKVKGGFLKIQGTWIPHEAAVTMARKIAWPIRNDLVPFFGPDFPDTCLGPNDPGYGYISAPKRKTRRPSGAVAGSQQRRDTESQQGANEGSLSVVSGSSEASPPYDGPSSNDMGTGSPISPLDSISPSTESGANASPHLPQLQYRHIPPIQSQPYSSFYSDPTLSSHQYHSPSPHPPSPSRMGYQQDQVQTVGSHTHLTSYGYPHSAYPSRYDSPHHPTPLGVGTNIPQQGSPRDVTGQYPSHYGGGQTNLYPTSSFDPRYQSEQQGPISHYESYGSQHRSPGVMDNGYGYTASPQTQQGNMYQPTHHQYHPSTPPRNQPYTSPYNLSGHHESHVRYSAEEQRGVGGEDQGERHPYTRTGRHEEYYPNFMTAPGQGTHPGHQQRQQAMYPESQAQFGYRGMDGSESEHGGSGMSSHHSNPSPSPFSPQPPYGPSAN